VATYYSLIIYLAKHYILIYCSLDFGTGTVGSIFSPTSSVGSLPKAFQTNTTCSFGFFIAHPLNQASLFRVFAIKKPPIYMGGFVASIGASLDDFAADVRSILEAKLKNL
jgi:hypothetical protein